MALADRIPLNAQLEVEILHDPSCQGKIHADIFLSHGHAVVLTCTVCGVITLRRAIVKDIQPRTP